MKKYIIGTIFGFVLATAVGANAQGVTNLINQVVQGVFPVTVEGTSIGEAVVIDNKTYLPVREFGEAVGYKVTFTEDREVILTKNVEASIPTTPTVPEIPQPTPSPPSQATGPTDDILVDATLPKDKQVEYLKNEISGIEAVLPGLKLTLSQWDRTTDASKKLEITITKDEKRVAAMKALLEQLQK